MEFLIYSVLQRCREIVFRLVISALTADIARKRYLVLSIVIYERGVESPVRVTSCQNLHSASWRTGNSCHTSI